jgi:hypothetical protein
MRLMLTDPREAHAEHNDVVNCLMGLASMARMVHALAAAEGRRPTTSAEADDFVHLVLGLASLGETVGLVAQPARAPRPTADPPSSPTTPGELLR